MITDKDITPEALVTRGFFLIEWACNKYRKLESSSFLSHTDVESAAYYGLAQTACGWADYCERRGFSPYNLDYFNNYARQRVFGAVVDEARSADPLGRRERGELKDAGITQGATESLGTAKRPYLLDSGMWNLLPNRISTASAATWNACVVTAATQAYLELDDLYRIALGRLALPMFPAQGLCDTCAPGGVGAYKRNAARHVITAVLVALERTYPATQIDLTGHETDELLERWCNQLGYKADELADKYVADLAEDPELLVATALAAKLGE